MRYGVAFFCLFPLTLAFGQQGGASPAAPAFEVASVKIHTGPPVRPPMRGGPGTSDPERFGCTWINLKTLITIAWELRPTELVASRLDSQPDGFDIEAKLPPNTSKQDFHLMLQRLLTERFNLAVHRESRTEPVFVLVAAKGGPKLHKAEPATQEEAPSVVPAWAPRNPSASRDKNGKLQIPPGHPGVLWAMVGGAYRIMARMQSSEAIAKAIEPEAGRRVIDKTGLTGLYDYTLDFSPVMDYSVNGVSRPGGLTESINEAVLHQLGLELKGDKAQVSVLVVDHFDSKPTEN